MTLPFNARRARNALARKGLQPEAIAQWLRLHRREHFARDYCRDAAGNPWRVRDYQRASLESHAPRKVHCDGRDVGKSAEIALVTAWAMVCCPDTEMLVATQTENHLFPLMHRVAERFEQTPAFAPSLVEMRRSPSWFLRFSNGFRLWGRIAGPRGTNFQGMHVDWQIVDEAQEMTDTAWGELLQALNGGGKRWVYGVPNGLRNIFHRMTQDADAEQYNWPSTLNPDYTAEKDAELIRLYGGADSPGYLHRVLGQHGTPAFAVFALEDYLACCHPALPFDDIALDADASFEAPADIPPGDYYLGCDLGYARDPSEFVVYRNDPPHLVQACRVHLRGVHYARQQQIIEELDRAYAFARIAIDCGNSGRAVAHQLMATDADRCRRIDAIEFGGTLDLGTLPDGRPHRRRTKEFMTELLVRHMADRSIVFPVLAARESQYAAHTYRTGALGQIVYDKGNDHLIDADRCAVLAHWRDTHETEAAPRGIAMPLRIEGW